MYIFHLFVGSAAVISIAIVRILVKGELLKTVITISLFVIAAVVFFPGVAPIHILITADSAANYDECKRYSDADLADPLICQNQECTSTLSLPYNSVRGCLAYQYSQSLIDQYDYLGRLFGRSGRGYKINKSEVLQKDGRTFEKITLTPSAFCIPRTFVFDITEPFEAYMKQLDKFAFPRAKDDAIDHYKDATGSFSRITQKE